MSKKLFAVALILSCVALVFAANPDQAAIPGGTAFHTSGDVETAPVGGGSVSWFSPPQEDPNGWYWGYDNAEPAPPFAEPSLSALPAFEDITGDGEKLAPYADQPFKYQLPDSFWYYGHWYEMDDYLYISADGWVSFDPNAEGSGFPDPPSTTPPFPDEGAPNAVIAPLWQNMNPTQSPDPSDTNRVYYRYTAVPAQLIIQWYETQGHANDHVYDFQLMLSMGGQQALVIEGACGPVFSYHFIHFIYRGSTHGWTADNGETGIENETGKKGIYYEGTINNGRCIRWGYKKIFQHDVKVTRFISPATTVLRWTEIEPIVEVHNVGQGIEHFSVTLDIYDENNEDEEVYHISVSDYQLYPGDYDTLVGPCWTPGELFYPDTHYYRKVAFTWLDRDDCFHNDTFIEHSIVHCDGWLGHPWNCADCPNALAFYDARRIATYYDADKGAIVLGGRCYMGYFGQMYSVVPPAIEVWEAQNGCGDVADNSYCVARAVCPTATEPGWNYAFFDQPVFVSTGDPGNFWMAIAHPTNAPGTFVGWFPQWSLFRPDPSACYNMDYDPSRSGYWYAPNGGPSSDFNWGGYPDAQYHTHPVEVLTHIGFRPLPGPPCYYDAPHDLACYEMKQPSGEYVVHGVGITPELGISNWGLEAEPTPGDFFNVEFIVVDKATSDTSFHETSVVSNILDVGDTIIGTTNPWTPEGLCDPVAPFVEYELIGLVCLGEVGPDESDHCPYNDTVRREVTCLLSHDVGVTDITIDPEPDEPPDIYYPGTEIYITATVENFGYHMENDVPVRCEIMDEYADTLIYNNVKNIVSLDWRGNPYENPYTTTVTFPTWTYPSDVSGFCIECRTEMEGDECPDDDFEVTCSPGLVEEAKTAPRVFRLEVPGMMIEDNCSIQFAVPHSSWVKLDLFDINGRWVKTIKNDLCKPGYYNMTWDCQDAAGRKVASGVYLIRMQADEFKAVRKIVIMN
jgi:hypothetical protein